MRKNYILFAALTASVGLFSFQHSSVTEFGKVGDHKQNGGGQPGLTGAPGENDCTQCHIGSVQNGTGENIVTFLSGVTPVTEYTPGNTYTVSLVMSSDPAKKGFSATALKSTNAMAGTFTGDGTIGGTQDFTNTPGTRQYVSHTSTSNTSSQNSWLWSWVAPTAGTGTVTFYVASNAANGNDQLTGDVIYLSTHTIAEANASVEENTISNNFKAGYSVNNREIVLDFNSNTIGSMVVNVVDMNGRSVYTQNLGNSTLGENNEKVRLPEEIEAGIYVVHFFVGNKAMSANIMVQ